MKRTIYEIFDEVVDLLISIYATVDNNNNIKKLVFHKKDEFFAIAKQLAVDTTGYSYVVERSGCLTVKESKEDEC